MRSFFRGLAVFSVLSGLPCASLAHRFGADGDDSATADISPSPSPAPFLAHSHKHHHSGKSPTPSPAPSDDAAASPTPKVRLEDATADGNSDADATPSPKPRKHRHPLESGDSADATPTPAQESAGALAGTTPKPRPSFAPDASLDVSQLKDFSRQPDKIQALIKAALDLTRQNLTYTYSSADPANGGMDCSGFVCYLLTQAGLPDVPRDASGQYSWVRKAGNFRAVISRGLDGFELDELKPGDLLFWSGTYATDRDPPVTHAMIYLGREESTGNRVMAGSSDGRSYHGLQRWGVSVFDFKPVSAAAPSPGKTEPRFIGYGAIPGL